MTTKHFLGTALPPLCATDPTDAPTARNRPSTGPAEGHCPRAGIFLRGRRPVKANLRGRIIEVSDRSGSPAEAVGRGMIRSGAGRHRALTWERPESHDRRATAMPSARPPDVEEPDGFPRRRVSRIPLRRVHQLLAQGPRVFAPPRAGAGPLPPAKRSPRAAALSAHLPRRG